MSLPAKFTRRSLLLGLVALGVTEALPARSQTEITVNTAEEFLQAIAPNRMIKLNPTTFVLSSLDPQKRTEYAWFRKVFDGYELVIENVENLTIVGSGRQPARILTQPRYADVFSFRNCQNIILNNFEAGHSPDLGFCRGGVLEFADCENVQINDAILFGSGTLGITAKNVRGLSCRNIVIKECTYEILCLSQSQNIEFKQCRFFSNAEFSLVKIYAAKNIKFLKCQFYDNKVSGSPTGEAYFFSVWNSSPVELIECRFERNTAPFFANSSQAVRLIRTLISQNSFSGSALYPQQPPKTPAFDPGCLVED
jgi:Right handed beta helix region